MTVPLFQDLQRSPFGKLPFLQVKKTTHNLFQCLTLKYRWTTKDYKTFEENYQHEGQDTESNRKIKEETNNAEENKEKSLQ